MKVNGRPPFPWPLLRLWVVRTLPAWCFVALILFLIQLAVCAIIHDNEQVKVYLAMIDMMPSCLKTAIGGDTLRVGNVAALIGIAALLGGWLLNAHARVPGQPLSMAAIVALVVFLAGFLDSADAAVSGGTVFMTLLISVAAPSRKVGLTALAILAGALLLAVAT